METTEISLNTGRKATTVDLTSQVRAFCRDKGDGLVSIFLPHATAGLAIFETGAGTESDLLLTLDELVPAEQGRWNHQHGSPGHGRDHVVPAFVSPSVTVPVQDGRMLLGTWQSIVLVDTNADNPNRRVRLSFLDG